MVFAMRRKVVLVCLLLAVVQRTVGQNLITGNDLPCQQPGEDPDPNNDRDNLSCPLLDPNELQCYSMTMLCDGNQDCVGGSDEGTDLVALECGKLQFNVSATQLTLPYGRLHKSCNLTRRLYLTALGVLCFVALISVVLCALPCLSMHLMDN